MGKKLLVGVPVAKGRRTPGGRKVQTHESCSSFFCGAHEAPHLYALLSGKGVLSEMFHFREVLDLFDNICFAEESKWILMTSVPDGRGITGTHVALDQEIREIISA